MCYVKSFQSANRSQLTFDYTQYQYWVEHDDDCTCSHENIEALNRELSDLEKEERNRREELEYDRAQVYEERYGE